MAILEETLGHVDGRYVRNRFMGPFHGRCEPAVASRTWLVFGMVIHGLACD